MTASFPHDMIRDNRMVRNALCPQCLEHTGEYIGRAKMRDIYQCSGTWVIGGTHKDCATIFYSSPYVPSQRISK